MRPALVMYTMIKYSEIYTLCFLRTKNKDLVFFGDFIAKEEWQGVDEVSRIYPHGWYVRSEFLEKTMINFWA